MAMVIFKIAGFLKLSGALGGGSGGSGPVGDSFLAENGDFLITENDNNLTPE